MSEPGGGGHSRASPGDLLRLVARLAVARLRGASGDPAAVGCRWARERMAHESSGDLELPFPGRRLRLVGNRDLSQRVLTAPPDDDGCPAGRLKVEAMRFLAPHALTITDGEAWRRLRAFNERVLASGGRHPFAQDFLDRVRAAFAPPATTVEGLRRAMGRAMVGIVFGGIGAEGDRLAADARVLFDVVASPPKRLLVGAFYRRRRARFYDALARRWKTADPGAPTLLALARREATATSGTPRELLEQVPNWMFTFTGSGTSLLVRTLTLVACRAEVRARVAAEVAACGDAGRIESLERCRYLQACLLEAGRLFPPVAKTFHRQPAAGDDVELVHSFPLLQRDEALGGDVHDFRPERWLAPELDAAAAASNLFLHGPRRCPGREIILLATSAAIARLIGEQGVTARAGRLARDPLPVSFPQREARFALP